MTSKNKYQTTRPPFRKYCSQCAGAGTFLTLVPGIKSGVEKKRIVCPVCEGMGFLIVREKTH